ncbi:MAG: hypothetical protein KGL39_21760 [Patescibacteria group bacterium]|nr:hypothetical protein [Patescibacteria group bacterium]
MIRPLTPADFPWCHDLCRRAYPLGYYDPMASQRWFEALLQSSGFRALRGDKAFAIAAIQERPWNPARTDAFLLPVVAPDRSGFELYRLIRALVVWAKRVGADQFHFDAITGVDFGPIAQRLGAKPASPNYILQL